MDEYYARILANFIGKHWQAFLSHVENDEGGNQTVAESIERELRQEAGME